MSLSQLLLGIWLILVGLTWAAVLSISIKFLGYFGAVVGIVWLVEGYHPITVYRRPQA
jgi:hypothetical protein